MTTTHTIPVRIGATVFESDRPNNSPYRKVEADRYEAYDLDEGEFLVVSSLGYHTIGRLTGRTRRFWQWHDCPTIERFEIETYADADGVIRGRKSDRIAGTCAIRPENLER